MASPSPGQTRLLRALIERAWKGSNVHMPGMKQTGRGIYRAAKYAMTKKPGQLGTAAAAGFVGGWKARKALQTTASSVLFGSGASHGGQGQA